MQTVESLKYKTCADLIRIMYIVSICTLIIEFFVMIVDYSMGKLSCTLPRYMLRYIICPSSWNLTMCCLLSKIDKSKQIADKQKTMMIIFCIGKIFASISIVHAYYLPTQCVFVGAIISAALLGDLGLIIFSTVDSIVTLFVSLFITPLFTSYWTFEQRLESTIMSSAILIMTCVLAYTIAKSRMRSDMAIEKYVSELENATQEAKLDKMTMLYNHAEFYNILHTQISKNVNQITVAIMDIDYFKQVNDTYGHDNGDKVILQIADLIRVLNDDETIFTARYGGEEFAFIFTNTMREDVMKKLQEIRRKISNTKFDFDENKKITMSGGIFECNPQNYSCEDIFSNADLALYFSKENGRNQLNIYNNLPQKEIEKLVRKHQKR